MSFFPSRPHPCAYFILFFYCTKICFSFFFLFFWIILPFHSPPTECRWCLPQTRRKKGTKWKQLTFHSKKRKNWMNGTRQRGKKGEIGPGIVKSWKPHLSFFSFPTTSMRPMFPIFHCNKSVFFCFSFFPFFSWFFPFFPCSFFFKVQKKEKKEFGELCSIVFFIKNTAVEVNW